MKFKFQSFVDLSTSAQSMQVIQWSVGGADVIKRCRHLFGAYKFFKLGKISIKMVPASTLPVDPLGLSYSDSDPQTVDPRDQMNPGLVRITNGEDIFTNVSALSEAQAQQMYNNMMLDPRWSKFMLQSGFHRSAYPMYWQIGQLSQDLYPGATTNIPPVVEDGTTSLSCYKEMEFGQLSSSASRSVRITSAESSPRGFFQVGRRGRLGYLPTDYYQEFPKSDASLTGIAGINNPPEVSVITCVLPKAYKTIYYYRVFITEEVYFTGLRSSPVTGTGVNYFGSIDNFVIGQPLVVNPGKTNVPMPPGVNDYGNYGDDKP